MVGGWSYKMVGGWPKYRWEVGLNIGGRWDFQEGCVKDRNLITYYFV